MKIDTQSNRLQRYLPTLREAKWWILAGIVWAILSVPVIIHSGVREAIYMVLGNLMKYLVAVLPILWALFFVHLVGPLFSQSREALVLALFLSTILGGLAGYILRTIVKAIFRR